MEKRIRTTLQTITEIKDKVFPLTTENTSLPYVIYTSTTDRGNQHQLNGYNNSISNQMQLSVYHSSYSNLKSLMKKITDKLKTIQGSNIGLYVEQLNFITQFETYENTSKTHKGIIEFEIFYQEV